MTESQNRLYDKLYHDLGKEIIACLEDKKIFEIMLNPDGTLWVDSVEEGQIKIGSVPGAQAMSILNSVAGINNLVVTQHSPMLEAEMPYYKALKGQRFTGQVPSIVSGPSFTIRKKSENIFTLANYIEKGLLTEIQAVVLKKLIKERQNILICGGPGSGKTTFTNALIVEAVKLENNQRFLILEDTPELQCSALNRVAMVKTHEVSMTSLLHAAMRMRPDRILIGEVRGREALDMLKAWNTGCPGGICTVHANGCREAIQRILDLSMEAGLINPPISLVAHTINAVVSVGRKNNQQGFISEIMLIKGYSDGEFHMEKAA